MIVRSRLGRISRRMGFVGRGRGACARWIAGRRNRVRLGHEQGGAGVRPRRRAIAGSEVVRQEAWVLRFAQDDDVYGGAGTESGFGCAARGEAPVCAGGGLRADGGRGELAGLPEAEDLFEAGEDAREQGGEYGVQGNGQHSPGSPRRGGGAHLGAAVG